MTSRTRSLAATAALLLVASLLSASTPLRAAADPLGVDSPAPPLDLAPEQGPGPQPPALPASVPGFVRQPLPGTASTAGPDAAVQRPVGPFGGAADYDSGWIDVDPGETRVISHKLGGDPDDYVVDLSAVAVGFISQAPFTQEGFGRDRFWDGEKTVEHGYAWHSLDDSDIKVTKGADDYKSGQLRLRIWRVPEADYDSGWLDISRSRMLTLRHELGGDADDYVVYLEFLDTDDGFGINRLAYGQDDFHEGDVEYYKHWGAAWSALSDQEVRVQRSGQDPYADQLRVRIWHVPDADYDSGWRDIDRGELLTLDHSLGGPWNDFYLDLQFWREQYDGRHQKEYGLDTQKPYADFRVFGAGLRYLLDGSASLYRGPDDILVDRVRVRIWANPAPRYDSGWVTIDPDEWLTLEHGLGGKTGSYHVDLQFRDTDADGDCCHGVNHWAYGGDIWVDAGDNQQAIGAYWSQLTPDSIVVRRFPDDRKADEVRVRIWLAPPPGYGFAGSGVGAGPGGRYDHNLGGDTGAYVVAVDAEHDDWLGQNSLGFGGDRITLDHKQGYHWTDLTGEQVDVVFGGQSEMAYPHVRIWRHASPDYDSGWRALTPATAKQLQHGLGFHPDLYVVDMQFQGVPGGLGVNQAGYGRDWDYNEPEGWTTWGGMWYDLTEEAISLWREGGDAFAARARTRIWYTGGCYALEAAVEPAAGGRVEVETAPNCGGGRGYAEGTAVQLTAQANAGYSFEHWRTVWGGEFSDNPQAFVVDGDSVITAHFAADADPFPVLFDEAHAERNTLSWTRAKELSDTLPWRPDPEWVYFGRLREALAREFTLVRNPSALLTDNLLQGYRALILAAPEEGLTVAEQGALRRYVRGGGGVVFLGDCGLYLQDTGFWRDAFGLAVEPGCLFSPIPDLIGDFAVTDFHDQAPGGVTRYSTNWLGSLGVAAGTQPLAWTGADTWEDTDGSEAFDPAQDESGKFLVLAEYDAGCGRVMALSDDAFQDANFEDYDNAGLMRAMLYRVMAGAPCGMTNAAYLPLVRR